MYYAKATLEGTANYASATSEAATIKIVNATFSVKADDYTDTYDGKPHTVTVTADGAKVSYSADAGKYKTYGSTVPTFTDVGEYTVYYKAVKANHDDVTGSVMVKITPAVLTATYVSEAVRYGAAPALKVDVTSFVNDETAETAADYVAPTVANSNTAVGEYTLTPAGGSAKNYTFNYVSGTLTILRRHTSSSTVTPEPEPTPDNSTSFADVPANAYYADAVKWAVDKGITNGLSDTMFGPYESCTRAQIVTFLWRAAGSPEPKTASSFTDVPASAYYAKAVAWAVENGITNGMTETTFAPDATCTRGQSVTFLYRALKGSASGSANFTDVKSDAFYADAVNWAVANNVTNGTSATTFSPNADCTRAEIVTFLYRAYQGK